MPPDRSQTPADPLSLPGGGRIGEFVVERTLGRGGFGAVYLARQLSLDRQVAVKVVAGGGRIAPAGEGRSLARLEHDHIVQVYSESTDPATGAHLLCMQYVPGTTLATVITGLRPFGEPCRQEGNGPDDRRVNCWDGSDFLAVLDGLDLPPALYEPAAVRDREALAAEDHVGAVCRIGERLARALAHAHARGVLHRDVKPANVLVNRYGRPLLADFNLASNDLNPDPAAFGGTLAYMAPEHLDACNPQSPTRPDEAGERSDLYSLAVVLWELSSGRLPFPPPDTSGRGSPPGTLSVVLHDLAARRRTDPPAHPPADIRLAVVLRSALAPRPEDRPASAARFAETLAGLAEQRAAVRDFPPPDLFARFAWRRPVMAAMLAGLLPQLLGSVLQTGYNAVRIVGSLSAPQRLLFGRSVLAYNLVMYPLCIAWIGWRVWRVVRVWRALRDWQAGRRPDPPDAAAVETARRRMLRLPVEAVAVACVGWLPGAVLFPVILHHGDAPLEPAQWWHFFVSFTLAGLIAVTYTFFGGTGVVLRSMYVRFWLDPRDFRAKAAEELADLPARVRVVNVLAGVIPLAGATMLVLAGPRGFSAAEYDAFRFLTVALILAGAAGSTAVARVSRHYLQVIAACTGRPNPVRPTGPRPSHHRQGNRTPQP